MAVNWIGGSSADALKHGVPRTSGPKPVSDQARKKELRKIEEYRNSVDIVNTDVIHLLPVPFSSTSLIVCRSGMAISLVM